MIGLSIIIPVYNEEMNIESTVGTLIDVLKDSGIICEIIAVNDGSQDNSLENLQKFRDIKIISHSKNRGYGASLKTGIKSAKYNNICITDADGTYPNDRIPDLYNTFISKGLDMVVGARTGKNVSYPFLRKIPKYFINKLANYISGTKIPDLNSGLRIFKKDIALNFFNLFPDGFSFTTTETLAMLSRGYEIEYIPINYFARQGTSKISPIKDTLAFFNLLCQIAVFFNPLKFFLPFVCILGLTSIAFLVRDIFILRNLSQSSVLFPILTLNLFFIALLADMISKK